MTLDHSHTRIILIGNSEYLNWPEGNIKNIKVNLEKLKDVLCDPGLVGIKNNPESFLELSNKSKVDIQVGISEFINNCVAEDNLIIYYAGHGLIDIDNINELYLATADTRIKSKKFTCIPSEELKTTLRNCKAGNKIMILDCCYAGRLSGLQSDPESLRINHWGDTQGVYFMMSSDRDVPSRFDPDDSTIPTFFTQRVIETIKYGADINDEVLTLDQFFDVMKEKWDDKIAPKPIKLSLKEIGSLPFCFNNQRLAKHLLTNENADDIRWQEIAVDPNSNTDIIEEFILTIKNNSQLEKVVFDFWAKMLDDFKLLAEASATGTFKALRGFIENCNPVPPVKKLAIKKMKIIGDENLTGSLRNSGRPARGSAVEIAGSEAFNPNNKIEQGLPALPDFNKTDNDTTGK